MKEFDELLNVYDGMAKEGFYQLRMAYKPLFDFYSRLIIRVGVDACTLPKNSLEHSYGSLRPLWGMVKSSLVLVDKSVNEWDEVINALHNIRTDAEHNMYVQIKLSNLEKIRAKAPDFKNWILNAGRQYFKQSKNFTLNEALQQEISFHISEAEFLLYEFGKEPPYMASRVWEDEYREISTLLQALSETKLKDVELSDLTNLLKLVELVAKFRGREDGLLQKNACPKCGGKISDTQENIGGSYEDGPYSIRYRTGCESCDYTLNSETEDL